MSTAQAPPPEVLMSTADVAELCQVPERTVMHWRETRTGPPFIRLGGRVRYRRDAVLSWIKQREKAS